jgi:hypothetical protein
MATTEMVDIWNRALNRIGQTERVESPDADSIAARVCDDHYDDCRDEALELRAWRWAKKQVACAELAGVTRFGWAHCYSLPPDFISARNLIDNDTRISLVPSETLIPYEVVSNDSGNGRILCTDTALEDFDGLEYTARIETVAAWPRLFVSAVAWRLAAELASGSRASRPSRPRSQRPTPRS